MAMLLFGVQFNQLSDDQTDLMQERTTEILASLGAAQLQQIGGEVGVDVVTYRSSVTSTKGELAIGKYLSPEVLLSYVQSLDERSGSFVSLEYFLRGHFKIEALYGRRGQSIGLGWTKDY